MGSIRVKVCGITNLEDAVAAVEAGADALGFNFFEGSRRYVAPEVVARIVPRLPPEVCSVGVFVDATRARVAALAEELHLTALQFHGDEEVEFCRGWPQRVIKAIRVRDRGAVLLAASYDVDFILVDAYVDGQWGGTGTRVALDLLAGFEPRRLILAGGLNADNVVAAVRAVRPFGVDVASGIESEPGRKDWSLMRRFIDNVHAA